MCSFDSVTYRLGAVVETDPPVEGTSLSVEDVRTARTVGLNVRERSAAYLENIKSAVEQVVNNRATSAPCQSNHVAIEDGSISPRFDPGLIIDFPRVELQVTMAGLTLDLEMRSCLTVCMGGQRSKIWTRCVLRKPANATQPLAESSVENIHNLFKDLATATNEAVRTEYEASLTDVYEIPIKLNYFGKINLLAVDCIGVSAPLERNCSHLMGDMKAREISNQELSDALRKITRFSLPTQGHDSTEGAAFTLSEQSDFYAFRGKNGAGSVFVSTTDDSEAYLAGIVNANETLETGAVPTGSGTTAEIAAFIGGAY